MESGLGQYHVLSVCCGLINLKGICCTDSCLTLLQCCKMGKATASIPFYQQGKWGSSRLGNFPKSWRFGKTQTRWPVLLLLMPGTLSAYYPWKTIEETEPLERSVWSQGTQLIKWRSVQDARSGESPGWLRWNLTPGIGNHHHARQPVGPDSWSPQLTLRRTQVWLCHLLQQSWLSGTHAWSWAESKSSNSAPDLPFIFYCNWKSTLPWKCYFPESANRGCRPSPSQPWALPPARALVGVPWGPGQAHHSPGCSPGSGSTQQPRNVSLEPAKRIRCPSRASRTPGGHWSKKFPDLWYPELDLGDNHAEAGPMRLARWWGSRALIFENSGSVTEWEQHMMCLFRFIESQKLRFQTAP